MKHPLTSVVIITYNNEDILAETIESVLAQDYPNLEIIISDDASADNTVNIAQQYAAQHPAKITVITTTQNTGVAGNWFKGVSHARGKYIAGLAGDDSIPPQKISKQVAAMENDANIAVCYTDACVFDVASQKTLYYLSDKSPSKSGDIKTALADSLYYSPTIMFKREYAPVKNTFTDIKHASDLAYFKEVMILSAPHGKIYYLPEILFTYNKHESNLTVIRNNENYKEHIKAIKILQKTYPAYQADLEPSIYDFCCVGFFKNMRRFRFNDSFYFLQEGLRAAHYNPLKFLRALGWAIKFFYKTKVAKRSV
jgi:glycosyltransferase involved in cell wall biosynthesis